jgi:hypothetical protein
MATDPLLKPLSGLDKFIARRSGSNFDRTVAHRLCLYEGHVR